MVARYDQLDFNKINYLKKRFNIHVGYSNHFFDMNTLSALSAYKPKVIMLYVKPTRKSNFIYPDHQHAVYLDEVEEMMSRSSFDCMVTTNQSLYALVEA